MVSRFQNWLQHLVGHLTGSGAMAQGTDTMAAGARGVSVRGEVQNSIIITGDGNTVYTGPPPRDSATALAIYCQVLAASHRHLPLRGVDVRASDATGSQRRLDLAQVYIALHTTTQVPSSDADERQSRERRPTETDAHRALGALEAVASHRHLVLLGDPGSGKSTFLTHLALCLAAQTGDSQGDWLARLPAWPAAEVSTYAKEIWYSLPTLIKICVKASLRYSRPK